ncbi:MAG: CPBP family intramembrane glutamic endopeptidase [Paracoccaceae bacterium]
MSYAPFAPMVDPARPYPALWRLALGVVTIVILTVLWTFALVGSAGLFTGAFESDTLLLEEQPGPSGVLISLIAIAGSGLACMAAARWWQKRQIMTLFGPARKTFRHFTLAAGISLAVMSVIAIATMPFVGWPILNMNPSIWLAWLPIALLCVLLQTGAEELVFRGYLQTQLAARFKSPIAWMIAPSLLFAALHYDPTYSTAFTVACLIGTFLFALVAADLTARTGSIGAAWGFHFANNTLAILLVSWQDSFSGLSLFNATMSLDTIETYSPIFVLDFLTVIFVWAVIRKVLAR